MTSLPTPTEVSVVGSSPLFVLPHDISTTDATESPNFTQRCSTASPGNSCILWSKGQGHESTGMSLNTLVSAGFFLLRWLLPGY